jgi:ATP phosphoribosyltransferase
MNEELTMALPKGRILDSIQSFFGTRGIGFSVEERKLVSRDDSNLLSFYFVKNSDLPTYVNHGIAGLGICGDDVLEESECQFFRLLTYSFGSTSMCLAGKEESRPASFESKLTVATKFPQFTRRYFNKRGIPVEIVKLNGSVELAPVLGLAPYIVDLVETGGTLKANGLVVFEKLQDIKVRLIANKAYYKLRYREINALVDRVREDT